MKLIAMILFNEMQNKKITYDELSAMTRIPKSSLQRYLTGERDFPIDRYEAICGALGLDPAAVLGWTKDDKRKDGLDGEIANLLSELPETERAFALDVLKRLLGHGGGQ